MEPMGPDCRRDRQRRAADRQRNQPEPSDGCMRRVAVCRVRPNADAMARGELLDRLIEACSSEETVEDRDREQKDSEWVETHGDPCGVTVRFRKCAIVPGPIQSATDPLPVAPVFRSLTIRVGCTWSCTYRRSFTTR